MGRRAYLNRLALGRSPYEAPEPPADSSAEQGVSVQRRISPIYADGYVQHYDERGHPVNPESKSFGRELRRAKNDILSTMGIVVSEDTNRGPNDQEKVDAIVAENDYGLIMVTLDQISVFLGSWWTTSLTGRIQTFKSYAHVPLTQIISHERASLGIVGFHFAGIPAWAMSTCISICRHHPLERLISTIQNYFPNNDAGSKLVRASFTILHSAIRGALLVLAMQTYMYSLLQSLHLISPTSVPGIAHFMPFGEFASMLLPSPPDLSLFSLGSYFFSVMKAPSLFYIYVYLRPVIEVRLYRLIRRRLPKPILTDDLSVKVAFDNDLIDWMVPTLGRRAVEETQRSNLSLFDDISYEMNAFRQWLCSKFAFRRRRPSVAQVTELQHEPETLQAQSGAAILPPTPAHRRHRSTESNPPAQPMPARETDAHSDSGESGLSNGDNRVIDADNMDLLRRARNLTLSTRTTSPDPDAQQNGGNAPNESRRQSRSNTLLSRSPSPESSQSSPRVRAQLIQDSDVIAMQLELESRHTQNRNATTDTDAGIQNSEDRQPGRRSISEILDTFLSSQDITTILGTEATDSDALSSTTAAVSPNPGEMGTTSISDDQLHGVTGNQNPNNSSVGPIVSDPVNILPDVVEEPPLDDTTNQAQLDQDDDDDDDDDDDNGADAESGILPHVADSMVRQNSAAGTTTITPSVSAHRVTILSALPVDSLASHLAATITTALFAPIETFYLRSLAKSYLSSKGATAAIRSDVYPVTAWGGGATRSDKLAYIGKLALMMGIQAAVNASVWGIISGSAIRIGRRWCGWGAL